MSGRINILKLFTFFAFAALLNGCGDDKPANEGNDTAMAVETQPPAVVEESRATTPPTRPVDGNADNTATATEDNTQETTAEPTDTSIAATDPGEAPQYHVECDDSGGNCRVNMQT